MRFGQRDYISYFKEVLCANYPVSVVNVTDACVMFAQCTVLSVVCPMSLFACDSNSPSRLRSAVILKATFGAAILIRWFAICRFPPITGTQKQHPIFAAEKVRHGFLIQSDPKPGAPVLNE